VLAAVKKDGRALEYATESLYDKSDIVLAALRHYEKFQPTVSVLKEAAIRMGIKIEGRSWIAACGSECKNDIRFTIIKYALKQQSPKATVNPLPPSGPPLPREPSSNALAKRKLLGSAASGEQGGPKRAKGPPWPQPATHATTSNHLSRT
jgi:hypothetical protein